MYAGSRVHTDTFLGSHFPAGPRNGLDLTFPDYLRLGLGSHIAGVHE